MKKFAGITLLFIGLISMDISAYDSVALDTGVDGIIDVDSEQPYSATPWIESSISFSGYPNLALSWFVDAAARIAAPLPDPVFSGIGVVAAGGSYRSGLSSVRFDIEGMADFETGGSPILLDISPVLSLSTGTSSYAIYAEISGRGAYIQGQAGWDVSTRGKVGYSVSVMNQLAPAFELSGSYSRYRDDTYRYTFGISADTPWYPQFPGTLDFRIAAHRSSGDALVESPLGIVYYPDCYWEASLDTGIGIALSRSMLLDFTLPMAIRRSDHGALVNGEPGSIKQMTFHTAPEISGTYNITSRLSARIAIGAALSASNSPDATMTRYYATVSGQYEF